MLLTLTVSAKRPVLTGRRGKVDLLTLPARIREELGLHGMNLATDMLAGADRSTISGLRDAADKSRCACLLLIELNALPLTSMRADGEKAQARVMNILEAASLLGCNSAAIGIAGPKTDLAAEHAIERLKPIVERAESLEVNLLLSPREGLTEEPDDLTGLIKRVGGFRIGTFPDFAAAQRSDDPAGYLRRLTPYASVVQATTMEFGDPPEPEDTPVSEAKPAKPESEPSDPAEALLAAIESLDDEVYPVAPHIGYDLEPMLKSVVSVGFDGTMAISYEGEGDPTLGVERSRDALEDVLDQLASSTE